jgi:hypothetical protein
MLPIMALLRSALLILLFSRPAVPGSAPPFTGYIVTAQWDGRTVPTVQWALDVTRQDTTFRFKQELKMTQLIPTTPGPADTPTLTAFDPKSRVYLTATQRTTSEASLWAMQINNAVTNVTRTNPDNVQFQYPPPGGEWPNSDELVGLVAFSGPSNTTALAVFGSGELLQVDIGTGKTQMFGRLCNKSYELTPAIAVDHSRGLLFAVIQGGSGAGNRHIVTYNLLSASVVSTVEMSHLRNHAPAEFVAFEMVWVPSLKELIVFYTGRFDQLVWCNPVTGSISFADFDLGQETGSFGTISFTGDPRLEDDDFWSNAAVDTVKNELYFQCTETDSNGDGTIAMCKMKIPAVERQYMSINDAIAPMTYGYAGMKFIQVLE